jgi:hypothetical protein
MLNIALLISAGFALLVALTAAYLLGTMEDRP